MTTSERFAMLSQDKATLADIEAGTLNKILTADTNEAWQKRQRMVRAAQMSMTTSSALEVSAAGLKMHTDPSDAHGTNRILINGGGDFGGGWLSSGHYSITPPAANTLIRGLGIPDTYVDVSGFIPLTSGTHKTLWYKLPADDAPTGTSGTWHISNHSGTDYEISRDMLFIALRRPNMPGSPIQMFDGRILITGMNYIDTPWIPLPLAAGFSHHGGGYQTGRYRRVNNRVYVEGVIKTPDTAAGTVICTLPIGFRPAAQHVFITDQYGSTPVRIDVLANGVMQKITPNSHGFLSLEFSFWLE